MSKWVYSRDEENFQSDLFNSKEEAVKQAKVELGDYGYTHAFIGRTEDIHPNIDVEHALEQVGETVYDEVGEVAEDYLCYLPKDEVSELQESINEVFNKWMTKYNNHPNFYKVKDIEKISLDLEEGLDRATNL